MKAAFEIVLDPESFERRAGRPAVGSVHVAFRGKSFPASDWSDFALEFLKCYLEAVLKLHRHGRSSVSFYEGPYQLRFERKRDEVTDEVTIEALDRDDVVHSASLAYADLLEHSMRAILPWIEHEQAVGAG